MHKIRFEVVDKISFRQMLEIYPELLFKEVKQKLSRAPSYSNTVLIVALDAEKKIALAVAGIIKGLPAADLISLYVQEPYRNKALATALLQNMEQALSRGGIRQLNAVYQSDWKGVDVFEKILSKTHWQKPVKKFELFKIDASKFSVENNWIQAGALPGKVKILPWETLSHEQKLAQAALCDTALLSPFQMEDKIAFNSQAAYINNEPAGYLVTHQLREVIQYTALYVKPCLHRGLIGAHLINTAGQMQYSKNSMAVAMMVDTTNTSMLTYSKRFKSFLTYNECIFTSLKKIAVGQINSINKKVIDNQ